MSNSKQGRAHEAASSLQADSSRISDSSLRREESRDRHSRSNRARKDKEHRSSSNRRNDQWEDDYSGRVSDRKPNRSHDRRVDVASDRHNPSAARSPRKAASETLTSAGHDVSSRSERGQKSPAVARTSRSPSSGASRSPLDLGTARDSSLLADAARLVKERERQRMAQELLTSSKAAAAHKSSTGDLKRKGRWADDGGSSSIQERAGSSEAEDGELPVASLTPKRRRPIVWPNEAAPVTGPSEPTGQLGELRTQALLRSSGFLKSVKIPAKELAVLGSKSPCSAAVQSPNSPVTESPYSRTSTGLPPIESRSLPATKKLSAAEIAAAELTSFQTSDMSGGMDSDVPAALRSSPSSSVTSQSSGRPESQAAPGSPDDDEYRPSRWAGDDEEPAGREAAEGEAAVAALNAAECADLETMDSPDSSPPEGASPASHNVRGVSMLQRCRSVDEYQKLHKISEGTYGVVSKAKEKATGRICALKKVKMDKEKDGFPLTAIREVSILLSFHHASIVDVSEVVVGHQLDSVYMVMEFMEHDLKQLLEDMHTPFSVAETKTLMWQLFDGIEYLHDNWVLHRDLKTSNILYNSCGELKICDFGLARQYGSPLKPYTHMVVTLWYRPPELLLGAKQYSTAVDMWSLGCIMAELLTKKILFDGKGELDQLQKIFDKLGSPTEDIWPGLSLLPTASKIKFPNQPFNRLRHTFGRTSGGTGPAADLSEEGIDLLNRLLTLDPSQRISAKAALDHNWFKEHPRAKDKHLMPTFPTREEKKLRTHLHTSPDPRVVDSRRAALGRVMDNGGGLFMPNPK